MWQTFKNCCNILAFMMKPSAQIYYPEILFDLSTFLFYPWTQSYNPSWNPKPTGIEYQKLTLTYMPLPRILILIINYSLPFLSSLLSRCNSFSLYKDWKGTSMADCQQGITLFLFYFVLYALSLPYFTTVPVESTFTILSFLSPKTQPDRIYKGGKQVMDTYSMGLKAKGKEIG